MCDKKVRSIYISGPLTTRRVPDNIREAFRVGELLRRKWFAVYIPHANFFWDVPWQHSYEECMEHDLKWVGICDSLYRMRGESGGADIEVAEAKELGKPVFYSVADACRWFDSCQEETG